MKKRNLRDLILAMGRYEECYYVLAQHNIGTSERLLSCVIAVRLIFLVYPLRYYLIQNLVLIIYYVLCYFSITFRGTCNSEVMRTVLKEVQTMNPQFQAGQIRGTYNSDIRYCC